MNGGAVASGIVIPLKELPVRNVSDDRASTIRQRNADRRGECRFPFLAGNLDDLVEQLGIDDDLILATDRKAAEQRFARCFGTKESRCSVQLRASIGRTVTFRMEPGNSR